jgi:hypothetical protein
VILQSIIQTTGMFSLHVLHKVARRVISLMDITIALEEAVPLVPFAL